MAEAGQTLREKLLGAWFTFDRRSLGLSRIAFGLVLLIDVARRFPEIDVWFGDKGLFPSWYVLKRGQPDLFSLTFWATTTRQNVFCFVVTALVYLLFTVGYRTKLFNVLAFAALLSIHSRISLVQNGGDRMMCIELMWMLFLPVGDRLSVDAVLASLRARRERTVSELADPSAYAPGPVAVRSVAVFAVLAQLVIAYLLNAVQKNSDTWKNGSAIYYVMMSERTSTAVACAIRDYLPSWAYVAMVRGTLVIEYSAPALLASPFGRVWSRRVAIALLVGFHMAIHELITVGLYSFVMCAYFPMFLGAEDWALLGRWFAGKRRVTLHADGRSPLAFGFARLVSRLDRFEHVTIVSGVPPEPEAAVAHALVAVDDATGARATGADAIAAVVAALPLSRPFSFLWRLAPMRRLVAAAFARELVVAPWLGAYAEGDPPRPLEREIPPRVARAAVLLREGACLGMMAISANEVLLDNEIFPAWAQRDPPEFVGAIVAYGQLYQGWNMFAPGVPTVSTMIFVDAVTSDGRHVDPYNELATRPKTWDGIPWRRLPECPAQDSFFDHYSRELAYRTPWLWTFRDWILRYPERTGNPEDRIVRFEVQLASDPIPDMWTHKKPGRLRWKSIFTWPTPSGGTAADPPKRRQKKGR